MNLKLTRISKNLTQNDLRKMSGVGLNTIVELEKGNIDAVKVGTLKRISKALDVSIVELFFYN